MNNLNFLEETEYIFESSHSLINRRLDNAISNYELEYFENHYVKESSQNKFWESVKKFFAELILSFKKFTNMITLKVNTVINSGLKKRLHAKLEMERKKGTRTIEIIDMEKYKDTYLDMVSDLWTYGKRIERANYKTVDQIDRDLEKFNSIAETTNYLQCSSGNVKLCCDGKRKHVKGFVAKYIIEGERIKDETVEINCSFQWV